MGAWPRLPASKWGKMCQWGKTHMGNHMQQHIRLCKVIKMTAANSLCDQYGLKWILAMFYTDFVTLQGVLKGF